MESARDKVEVCDSAPCPSASAGSGVPTVPLGSGSGGSEWDIFGSGAVDTPLVETSAVTGTVVGTESCWWASPRHTPVGGASTGPSPAHRCCNVSYLLWY